MGAQQAKQETVNEIVSVNAGVVAGQNESIWENNSSSKLEIFGIAVLAVITCATIAKIVVKYFKKAVQRYSVNHV
jgi:hypothetical protein